jgi:hypothetical protein
MGAMMGDHDREEITTCRLAGHGCRIFDREEAHTFFVGRCPDAGAFVWRAASTYPYSATNAMHP